MTSVAATPGTDQEVDFDAGDILVARNSGAGAHTVTVYSAADPVSGRTNHITTEAIAAGVTRLYGPFRARGWKQSNGKLKFTADDAEVLFSVITGR